MRVKRFAGPEEVDAQRWDRGAGDGLYLSHRWLSAMSDRRRRVACYLLVERDGEPVAAAVLHRVDRPGFVLQEPVGLILDPELRAADQVDLPPTQADRLGELAGRLRAGSADCYPAAVCVTPAGLSAGARLPADPEVAAALAGAVDEVAGEWQASTRAVLYLEPTAGGPEFGQALAGHGYRPASVGIRAGMTVRWPDLTAYLAGLRANKRNKFGKELAAPAAAGLRIEVVPAPELEPMLDELAALAARVQERHGNDYDEAGARGTLEFLIGRCPDLASAVLLRSEDRIVAFHLFYRYRDGLYSAFTGRDYSELAWRVFAHFHVLWYQPMRIAAAEGRSLIDYGLNPPPDLLHRGGRATPLTGWFDFRSLPAPEVEELLGLISAASSARLDRLARGG